MGKDSLTVSQGDHTITVTAGNSTVSAGQSITLKVGPNSIKIDTTGVTISATKISISATASLEASGLTTKIAGQTMLQLDGGPMAELTGGLVKIN
jgi:type VI secretion system secreted protein VgrG